MGGPLPLDGKRYAQVLSPLRASVRERLAPLIVQEQESLVRIQKAVNHPLLDPYFVYTTHLGTHTFFMLILPLIFWFGYGYEGRSLTLLILLGVFFSGFLKDAICLPRPMPPVRRLTMSNSTLHLEYGFPSTHTTNAVSVTLFLLTEFAGVEGPWAVWGRVLAVVYGVSVSFGRIYCGMHGIVDVASGGAIGLSLWGLWYMFYPAVDLWIRTGGILVPTVLSAVIFTLVTVHPDPVEACPCFEDSVAAIGVVYGLLLGAWMSPEAGTVPVYHVLSPVTHVLRIIIGVGCVFVWRLMAKSTCHRVLPPMYRLLHAPYRKFYSPASSYGRIPESIHLVPSVVDMPSHLHDSGEERGSGESIGTKEGQEEDGGKRRYDIDIVTKIIVYGGIGWWAMSGVPTLFEMIGLGSAGKA